MFHPVFNDDGIDEPLLIVGAERGQLAGFEKVYTVTMVTRYSKAVVSVNGNEMRLHCRLFVYNNHSHLSP